MQVLSLDERLGQRSVRLRNILLATDGTPAAHLALGAAADLARRSGASLHLVTAYEFAPSSVLAYAPYIGPNSAWDSLEADARRLLDDERDRVVALGATVGSLHVAREPAFSAVMDVAEMVEADLVVLGSRELNGLRRLVVGSVSEHVVHSVHRPVLIVRGGEGTWPPAHVIVGFDNSSGARCAARFAATITHLYKDLPIELVEADAELSVAADRFLGPDDREHIDSESLFEYARTLDTIAGRTVETAVVVGDPADALNATGSRRPGTKLIVVGSRDLGAVRRFLLGSVSTKLLHSGHAALLVVPEHATQGRTNESDDKPTSSIWQDGGSALRHLPALGARRAVPDKGGVELRISST
ncbi:MAG: universal stress protein [Candidatus Dormiibacterota bacterium]